MLLLPLDVFMTKYKTRLIHKQWGNECVIEYITANMEKMQCVNYTDTMGEIITDRQWSLPCLQSHANHVLINGHSILGSKLCTVHSNYSVHN